MGVDSSTPEIPIERSYCIPACSHKSEFHKSMVLTSNNTLQLQLVQIFKNLSSKCRVGMTKLKDEPTLTPSELDWIQLKKDINSSLPETTKDKLIRKIKQNPVVPIGCLATASALTYGLWSFRKGDRRMSQMMMRTRIIAQGFTVVALIVGVALTYTK